MAAPEDAASVLEWFVQDASNLPAEIAHLMEEINAKDKILLEHKAIITTKDNSIQKWVRVHGSLVPHPKEEAYLNHIRHLYAKINLLSDEKLALAEQAEKLLNRHLYKLDTKIRDITNEGSFVNDPPLPSVLPPQLAKKPLPITIPFMPQNSMAGNANTNQLHPAQPLLAGLHPSSSNLPHNAQLSAAHLAHSSAPVSPSFPSHQASGTTASSHGLSDAKRRRLTNLAAFPSSTSLARPASLGPGTSRAGTPASARSGSAGPRALQKKASKKLAPHQLARKHSLKALHKKPLKRFASTSALKASPSETGDEESLASDAESSPLDSLPPEVGGGEAEAALEDEGEDTHKYCTCQSVSHGNMVACDNEQCPYEWFHWPCVGMTKEPVGKWYCEACRAAGLK